MAIKFVRCPECENEQGDMGSKVACEECGYFPMPYYNADGKLIGDQEAPHATG